MLELASENIREAFPISNSWIRHPYTGDRLELEEKLSSNPPTESQSSLARDIRVLKSIVALYRHRYFERRWVIQEMGACTFHDIICRRRRDCTGVTYRVSLHNYSYALRSCKQPDKADSSVLRTHGSKLSSSRIVSALGLRIWYRVSAIVYCQYHIAPRSISQGVVYVIECPDECRSPGVHHRYSLSLFFSLSSIRLALIKG